MPKNIYFSQGSKNEQLLYEDLIIESMKIAGQDVYYLPRTIVELDKILNEDIQSKFDSSYMIEMYLESVEGYEGDGKFLSKFGLEIRDQVILVCSKRRWMQLVGRHYAEDDEPIRPKEGDLIYFPQVKGLFEIKYADGEKPFHQLKNLPTYKFTCELYEYRNEDLGTGIDSIDSIQSTTVQSYRAAITFTLGSQIVASEKLIIELPTGIMGSALGMKIESLNGDTILSTGTLTFDDNRFHKLVPGTTFTGVKSGSVMVLNRLLDLDQDPDVDLFENDPVAQNAAFEDSGNEILEFAENNPFGEPDDL